jgi:hypothetical protein
VGSNPYVWLRSVHCESIILWRAHIKYQFILYRVDVDWMKEINLFFSFLFYSILIHLLDELWLEELDEVVWEDAHPPLQLTLPPALVLHIPAITENLYNSVPISCVADPGCLTRIRIFSIPDPGSEFFYPGSRIRIFLSRIRIKEFTDSNQKKS